MRRSKLDDKKVKISKDGLKRALSIFKYIKPYRGYFIFAMIFLALGSGFFLLLIGAAKEMTNVANGTPSDNIPSLSLNQYGLLFLVVLIIQGLFSYVRTYFFAIVSERGMADLRRDVYNKIITQTIAFFERRRVGELTSRITTDIEQLQSVFSHSLAEFLRQVIILLGSTVIIFFIAPKLSLTMLATFPFVVVLAMVFGRYKRRLSKKRQDALAHTNTVVEETFHSFSVVKSFANEWYESKRYGGAVQKMVDVALSYAKVRGVFFMFVISILFGGIFFILWRGAILVQEGEMMVGDLFGFILYTGIMGGAIAGLGNLYTVLAGAIGATERIQDILMLDEEVELKETIEDLDIVGNVDFKNVHFSYPTRTDVKVLKGIDINIKAGEKIALVGQSGSGKSTIVKLLLNFYDLEAGDIMVDGKSIKDMNLNALRKNIGIVPQEVILFGGTIKENILYGKPNATDEELMEAAQRSNCWDFIQGFPEKMETVVGERGIKLSGGQRQRVAIARAILKNPKILLLDEATSSLDAESEKVVQDALDELLKGRTSIIIAHRLSTIKEVDCIYVIENGVMVEKGTHDELSNDTDGAYHALAKLQFELH
jgi:ABC-type multidrug transport system fused ATPase/permease subunit